MRKLDDLTGKRFGRLVVVERGVDYQTLLPGEQLGRSYTVWRCRCDCGEITDVCAHNLRTGRTRSCGCLRRETSAENGRRKKGKKRGMKK